MKNIVRILTLIALAATFALPALAQDAAATAQTDADAKAALYAKFYDNYNQPQPDKQKIAYEAGKEYVAKYGSDQSEDNVKIIAFISKWLPKYEKAVRDFEFDQALKNKQNARAFELGRQIVAVEPENLSVNLRLAAAGLSSAIAKDTAHNADTINVARRALQLIESGKTPANNDWLPFPNRDEAVGALNWTLGWMLLESSPADAANYLVKVAQGTSRFKKEPTTYFYLGSAYYNSPEFKRLLEEYNAKYAGKDATPEGTALLDRINHILDRVIDAYARAAALATDATQKAAFMKSLTTVYTARHEKEAGLTELVNSVASRPLPLLSDPVTPSTPPATTTTSGTTTPPAASSTANGTGTKPAAATPASSTPGAKPTPSPAPPKPRQ